MTFDFCVGQQPPAAQRQRNGSLTVRLRHRWLLLVCGCGRVVLLASQRVMSPPQALVARLLRACQLAGKTAQGATAGLATPARGNECLHLAILFPCRYSNFAGRHPRALAVRVALCQVYSRRNHSGSTLTSSSRLAATLASTSWLCTCDSMVDSSFL